MTITLMNKSRRIIEYPGGRFMPSTAVQFTDEAIAENLKKLYPAEVQDVAETVKQAETKAEEQQKIAPIVLPGSPQAIAAREARKKAEAAAVKKAKEETSAVKGENK